MRLDLRSLFLIGLAGSLAATAPAAPEAEASWLRSLDPAFPEVRPAPPIPAPPRRLRSRLDRRTVSHGEVEPLPARLEETTPPRRPLEDRLGPEVPERPAVPRRAELCPDEVAAPERREDADLYEALKDLHLFGVQRHCLDMGAAIGWEELPRPLETWLRDQEGDGVVDAAATAVLDGWWLRFTARVAAQGLLERAVDPELCRRIRVVRGALDRWCSRAPDRGRVPPPPVPAAAGSSPLDEYPAGIYPPGNGCSPWGRRLGGGL